MSEAHLDDSGGELGPHVQGVVLHHVERHRAHHQHVLLVVEVHAAGEDTHTHTHTHRFNTEQNTGEDRETSSGHWRYCTTVQIA